MSIFEAFLSTPEATDALGDRSFFAAMLRFEAALARAQADTGLIAASAAQSIAGTCKIELFDVPKLVRESTRVRCLATPLLGSLRETVALFNTDAAAVVNHGCSFANVVDSAMALISRDVLELIEADLTCALSVLLRLATLHGADPMLARAPLQPVSVTSFGLRCIQWAAPLLRSHQRLQAAARNALQLQMGDELTDYAKLKVQHTEVANQMAAELQLTALAGGFSCHDEWAVMVNEVGLLTTGLGEIAADIWRMMQPELAELAPAANSPLPGSSTACMVALAAAQRTPPRVAALLANLARPHARGLGKWQASLAEWPALLMSAHGAARAVADLLTNLQVNTASMRNNLNAYRANLPPRETADRLNQDDVTLANNLTKLQLTMLQTELATMPAKTPQSGRASASEHHLAIA